MGKITINEIHKSLFDYVQAVSDDKLETRNKTIVGAINELFSNNNNNNDIEIDNLINEISNGKQLIANAIGEPLTAEDSFNEMSDDINNLLSTFKTNMMNNGVTVESNDKFKSLIDKIATMVEEGSGKGIQFVRKDITLPKGSKWLQVNDLGFKANIVMYDVDTSHVLYNDTAGYDQLVLYPIGGSIGSATYSSVSNFPGGMYINENGFRLPIFTAQYTESNTQTTVNKTITIIAIGVGEEDTTLRDSLANILENKGVDVTEEDDMASLISKVDGFIPHPPAIAGDDHIIYENTNVFTGYNQDGIGKLISEFNNFKIGGTYRIYFSSHSSGGHSSRPYYEHIRNSTVINTGQTYGGGWYAEVSTFDVPNVLPGDTIKFYMNSSASDWEVDKHGIRCSIDDSYFLI